MFLANFDMSFVREDLLKWIVWVGN